MKSPAAEVILLIVCLSSFMLLLCLQMTGYINWPIYALLSPFWLPILWVAVLVGLGEMEERKKRKR